MVFGRWQWRLFYACVVAFSSSIAHAQLRIVSYNTATAQAAGGTQTARAPHASTVFAALGLEEVNDLARPVDVLLLQEQFTMQLTTQSFVDLLNDLYDPVNRTMYARSTVNGQISNTFNGSGGRPGLVYNTQTVQLIGESQVGDVGSANNQQPRATMRYQLRPVGYDESADFYAYSSHHSASLASQRLAEAQAVRASADALPSDSHVIYAGDFNTSSSNVGSYQHLVSAGNAQAIDPLDKPGIWSNRQYFNNDPSQEDIRYLHTQSPAADGEGIPGFAESGMDDRYDFQLVTSELLDGEGLSLLAGSYHAFGNNGTHDFNGSITTGTGASADVLSALKANSDHLPVVADYQLPANMLATLADVPDVVGIGSTFGIDVFVENVANVLDARWADELDYTISVSGALSGSALGTLEALAGASAHQVFLDTSTLGDYSGQILVSTSSQGAANSLFEFDIAYSVINLLAADFNQDGTVDGADLAKWELAYGDNTGGDADFDGDTDGADFLVWQRQFGENSVGLTASTVSGVPEPTALMLAVTAGLALIARRPIESRAVTPRTFHNGA